MSIKFTDEEDSRYILFAKVKDEFFAGIGNPDPESLFQEFTKKYKPNGILAVVPKAVRDEVKSKGGLVVVLNEQLPLFVI